MDLNQVFEHLTSKIGLLLFGKTEGSRNLISKILDQLNSLNYIYPFVTNSTKALLLVNQCCSFIPADDLNLVPKFCQLLANLIKHQNVIIEGRTLNIAMQWCLQALANGDDDIVLQVLKALDALLRNNFYNIPMLTAIVIKQIKIIIDTTRANQKGEPFYEITLVALQCIKTCTVFSNNDLVCFNSSNFLPHFDSCAQVFTSFLCRKSSSNSLFCLKILETCLLGLQNIINIHPKYLQKELQLILGIIKTYILYDIKDLNFIAPHQLMPSTLSVPEILSNNSSREKTGGKVTKQRKHRTSISNNKKKNKKSIEDFFFECENSGCVSATPNMGINLGNGIGQVSISKTKTSDSDSSDSEGGRLAKLNRSSGKVRQAALNLFYSVIKLTDKSTIFSYWTSFVPEGPTSGKHNLVTCILKDPSARGKMAALNVLLLLLTGSKPYLIQAETGGKCSFTPFSVVLGLTLTELHHGLTLALNQVSVPVLAQTLKCIAALVQATPYHRMGSGLVTKVIRNVKELVYHRDASVQVTALIVIGCILASEPVIQETKEAIIKLQKKKHREEKLDENQSNVTEKTHYGHCNSDYDDFDYAQFSSSDDEENKSDFAEVNSMPWLLRKCLTNLGMTRYGTISTEQVEKTVPPAPVKLESLQVLSAMSRNYFDSLMIPYLSHVAKVLETALMDKYTDLRLHAGRTVDFIGQAINRFDDTEDFSVCLNFWQTLLGGGSLVSLIQNDQHASLRAVGCDCLGSIGPCIFQQLTREKQILVVTLLFACAKDEENGVRGAAVRALALCVLYPALREDSGFVVDTAETILEALSDENVTVRVKASWSLGNLSDALVLNKNATEPIYDTLPEKLLIRLLLASTKTSMNCDKIKMNAVRAIGNLMQLIDEDLMKIDEFKNASRQALSALITASTTGTNVKVRWNACYAVGNTLKNPALYTHLDVNLWQPTVFNKLNDLVVGFKNFKVRIKAALALASPVTRGQYGQFFIPTWIALLKALENSHNMEDFTEYKHRDHLVEQICFSLAHLTTLLSMNDLRQLETTLSLYSDTFKSHMQKVLERSVPEKSTKLYSALCFLNTMESITRSDSVGVKEKEALQLLKNIFLPQF